MWNLGSAMYLPRRAHHISSSDDVRIGMTTWLGCICHHSSVTVSSHKRRFHLRTTRRQYDSCTKRVDVRHVLPVDDSPPFRSLTGLLLPKQANREREREREREEAMIISLTFASAPQISGFVWWHLLWYLFWWPFFQWSLSFVMMKSPIPSWGGSYPLHKSHSEPAPASKPVGRSVHWIGLDFSSTSLTCVN